MRHAEKQHLHRKKCKTNASITKDSNLLKKKKDKETMQYARPNPYNNQMHRRVSRAGKTSGPRTRKDQRIQKGILPEA